MNKKNQIKADLTKARGSQYSEVTYEQIEDLTKRLEEFVEKCKGVTKLMRETDRKSMAVRGYNQLAQAIVKVHSTISNMLAESQFPSSLGDLNSDPKKQK